MKRYLAGMVVILLAAAFLRLYELPGIPPGLTHDEADHTLSAWGVVNGIRPLYFTIGYGREPLYDYVTAGLMQITGPTYLAGRLVSVYFSLLLIAGMAAWARLTFGRQVSWLAAAGLAVGFWPLMTARQGLRSITQPTLFVLAAWSYWRWVVLGVEVASCKFQVSRSASYVSRLILPALLLGLSFYTYIPARIMWVVFPGVVIFIWLKERRLPRLLLAQTTAILGIAAAIGFPLFLYLHNHPEAETRIGQLSGPLTQALQGDWGPLLTHATGALRLFTLAGDTAWRYNIAGKPWLNPVLGVLFYGGVGLALFSIVRRQPFAAASFFALLWLFLGLTPALITGPELSTTQAIALQPVLYLFPALLLGWGWQQVRRYPRFRLWPDYLFWLMVLLLYGAAALQTAHDYFTIWGTHPEVRVQYETNLVETIRYVNKVSVNDVAISTTTPGRFHSPAVALATMTNDAAALRWFDGRYSLLIPTSAEAWITFSGFAPLHPVLQNYFAAAPHTTLPLQPDDKDRPVTIYQVNSADLLQQWQTLLTPLEANFGEAVRLRGYTLSDAQAQPGTTIWVTTWWEVVQPANDLVFFTHLTTGVGEPIAQADRLDVPAPNWIAGDQFLQLHELTIPDDSAAATYALVVGVYHPQPPYLRLPVRHNGTTIGDSITLTTIPVTNIK